MCQHHFANELKTELLTRYMYNIKWNLYKKLSAVIYMPSAPFYNRKHLHGDRICPGTGTEM